MTSKYLDEEIRYAINQIEQQEECDNQSIYDGVTINEENYVFEEMKFFDKKFKIHLPTNFIDMPDELARIKYPSGERPQIIKSNKTGNINVTLSRISNTINDSHIPQVRDGMKAIFKKLNPSYLFLEEGIETVEDKTVGFFEFKSPALDGALFNFMFVVELSHDIIMGNVSCPYNDHPAWRPVAHQIMQSVRIDTQPAGGQKE